MYRRTLYIPTGSPPSRGAWIEIFLMGTGNRPTFRSPPSRGAWIEIAAEGAVKANVESPPSRGAWIEIRKRFYMIARCDVAPLAGGVD